MHRLFQFNGILYDGNWKFLSDNDFNHYVTLYGVRNNNITDDKNLKLASIISIQNGMLRELVENWIDFELRGYSYVIPLIQPRYDPENVIKYNSPSFNISLDYLWKDTFSVKK